MSKTTLTRQIEGALWKEKEVQGVYGCFEVTIGAGKGREIIDFITYQSNGEFNCYEIKVTKADFNSSAKLSFHGDFNYYVIPSSLYDEMSKDKYFEIRIKNSKIGLIVVDEKGKLNSKIKAKRKFVKMATRAMLLEKMICSLNREVKKFYRTKPYWNSKGPSLGERKSYDEGYFSAIKNILEIVANTQNNSIHEFILELDLHRIDFIKCFDPEDLKHIDEAVEKENEKVQKMWFIKRKKLL